MDGTIVPGSWHLIDWNSISWSRLPESPPSSVKASAKRLQTREEVARLTMTVAETNPLVLKTTVWCAWQLLHNVIQVSAHFNHHAADCTTVLPLLYKSPRPRPPPPVPGGKTKWLSAWNGCSVYLCMGSRLLIIISQENETHGALKNQQDWICCASLLSEYQTRL